MLCNYQNIFKKSFEKIKLFLRFIDRNSYQVSYFLKEAMVVKNNIGNFCKLLIFCIIKFL